FSILQKAKFIEEFRLQQKKNPDLTATAFGKSEEFRFGKSIVSKTMQDEPS
ncbi:hypothetical protein CPC16_010292, partial [Podila verticillata]